ncbi:UNVERIFIED_CONTAM: putative mitochondrial protein [Sesamum latifolium]|uniref:Mitochondrial protein n=1 Tax=Sesamum latifolium TaxID=2727402 RepID=A0AAW2U7X1_9LAMI
MSLLVWNCQGIGGPWMVRNLGDLIQDTHPDLVFLAKTKCSSSQIEILKRKLDFFGVNVDSRRKSGGLALLWNKSVEVQLQSMSQYHIDISIKLTVDEDWWRFTGFSGKPDTNKQDISCNLLSRLHAQSVRSWLVAGNFNELLDQSEKKGGPNRPLWQIKNFRKALENCNLSDLGYTGTPFTWNNRHRHPDTVYERLDRACANPAWIQRFQHATVSHLHTNCSDHNPILIKVARPPSNRRQKSRPWRFEAAWLQDEQCEGIVSHCWARVDGPASHERFQEKIACCRSSLSFWNKMTFLEHKERVKELESRLKLIRTGQITTDSRKEEDDIRKELEFIAGIEETKWKQRSKDLWLKEGDRNTHFFHNKASNRFQRNMILKLKGANEQWVEEEEEIQQMIIDYFHGVFGSCNPDSADMRHGLEGLRRVVDSNMAEELTKPYMEAEITKALFQMAPLKSPGPYGMPPIFYHIFWPTIKSDVCFCGLRLLNNLDFPASFNDTQNVLIPKCKNPVNLFNFLPISLCNVIYKITSKTIGNRLKPFLTKIISPSQSAFVPGRIISDNILTAFEINHFLNTRTKGKDGYMALKLDVSKAYDKVEWVFLKEVMHRLGFPTPFVNLVMMCVTSASYSFLLNGHQFGSLNPQRGLRQGDSLSPYLFLFCTELFSSLLQLVESAQQIRGVSVCRWPREYLTFYSLTTH